MYRTMVCASVVFVAAAIGSAARAASVSELLEKGIYTEETVGNLDEAITLYEKVVAEAKANQGVAAQAQFRLGQCLLKQGKKAEATAAFEKLIGNYPDEKDLVAKARKFVPEGLPLEPVPWVDGESLQLRMRMAGGMDIGTLFYTAESAEIDGRKVWRVGSRTLVTINKVLGRSSVDADWNTFRPITSVFANSLMGETSAKYSPTQVTVTTIGSQGESTKKIDEARVAYDNEQAMDMIRRLPLAVGYKTTLPIFVTFGGGFISLEMEVQGKETLKVPAGEFECFKVHLGLVNQDFWFSADSHCYLVRFDANSVVAELSSIGEIKPGESHRYEDAERGFSFTAPSDWFFYAPSDDQNAASTVYLLDPQAIAFTRVHVSKPADLKADEQKSLRAWAEKDVAELAKELKDFKVSNEGWQEKTISSLPALCVVADYSEGKHKMVGCFTYVRTDSLALQFVSGLRQGYWKDYRPQFDKVIDSLKVKQP